MEERKKAKNKKTTYGYHELDCFSGAVGGNVAGAAMKDKSLGAIGSSIAGIVGGGIGGTILQTVLGSAAAGGGGMDMQSILANVGGGGVGSSWPSSA
jgi:hypothetical protein